MLFLDSCESNSRDTVSEAMYSGKLYETPEVIDNSDVLNKSRLAVINTDCDYYSRNGKHIGMLKKGESVFILDYYNETVDNIFNNDYGKHDGQDSFILERVIRLWRAFYSEWQLRISENYLIIGNAEDAVAYRIESVKKKMKIYIHYTCQNTQGENLK